MKSEEFRIYVYFILNPQTNEVKIGWSQNPKKRLATLSREEETKLILLTVMEDVIPLEMRLHRRFAKLNTRGEWFQMEDDLLNYVNEVSASRLELPTFPEPKRELIGKKQCRWCGIPTTGKKMYCCNSHRQKAYYARKNGK